jgi:hypothetical protein
MLVTRRGSVTPKAMDDRIKQQTQTLFDKNTADAAKQIDRKYFPTRSNDVPPRAALTLCVMGLDRPFGEATTTQLIETIIRECGGSGRTYKSALLFAVPDSGDAVRDAARNLLAWEDIDDDADAKKRWEQSDPTQLKLLARNLTNAKRELDEAIFRTYRHVYLLGKDNKLQHVDLGQVTSSAAASPVELILRELTQVDIITESVSPNKLLKYWPPALVEWSTQGVRDAFFSSPQLPRLLNPEAIKRAICDGVTQGVFGYASRDPSGNIKLDKLQESLFDTEVDIADDVYIIKAADAQKLLEPPRLARLALNYTDLSLAVGEQASFICSALDQYGQPFPAPSVKWTATGGEITPDGLFTAGKVAGAHSVIARGDGLEAIAEVRIRPAGEPVSPGGGTGIAPKGKRLVRWRGVVPPQKWMNFYTKVLTRFSANADLRLEVSVEVPLDPDDARAKSDEAKSGLKELGLSDNVEVT